MRKLSSDYTVEVDNVDKDLWYKIIHNFSDANLYQTWSYDAIRCGRENISHLVVKKKGVIVAASQARIVKVPLVNVGIAYIRWGPLWHSNGKPTDIEEFIQAIRALRNEYVCRRGLVLRILPVLFSDDTSMLSLLEQEEYHRLNSEKRQRTLLINMNQSLEDLRKGLDRKWRNHLNRAERNQLELIEGYDDELFGMFAQIYVEMKKRKKFTETTDINEFRLIQNELPSNFKMKVFLCLSDGKLCSGAIVSTIGKTGIYLFGATNRIGMKDKGSYLLQWKIIEWLKKMNCSWYDLHGINPIANPGTYNFKAGLCGKNGKDVEFLGRFNASGSLLKRVIIKSGDIFSSKYAKVRNIFQKYTL